MKMLKIGICLLMVLCLAGCGKSQEKENKKTADKTELKENSEVSKGNEEETKKTDDKKDVKKETTSSSTVKKEVAFSTSENTNSSSAKKTDSKKNVGTGSSQSSSTKKEEVKKEEPKKSESKPTPKPQPKPEPKPQPPKKWAMTENEMIAYAKSVCSSLGFVWADDATKDNSGWFAPTTIKITDDKERIKYLISISIESTCDGLDPEQYGIKGYFEKSKDGNSYKFYVLY